MTPAQLRVIAELHAVANGTTEQSHAAPEAEGTVGDLMAFASMTRR